MSSKFPPSNDNDDLLLIRSDILLFITPLTPVGENNLRVVVVLVAVVLVAVVVVVVDESIIFIARS